MKHLVELLEDFLRAYFDKLLLTVLFLILVGVGFYATVEKVKEWAMGEAGTVIGAIIMLTTGKIIQRVTNGSDKTSVTVKTEKLTQEQDQE